MWLRKKAISVFAIAVSAVCMLHMRQAGAQNVENVERLNSTAAEVCFDGGYRMTVDFYAPDIFRLFRDDNGGIVRNPEADPPADILVKDAREKVSFSMEERQDSWVLSTGAVEISFARNGGSMTVRDSRSGKTVLKQAAPVVFATAGGRNATELRFCCDKDEWFYGGGVQNGRFSHKGQKISIVNENSWTDGGVASPAPYYWSTAGYGILWHTFDPGHYDFGSQNADEVVLTHYTDYLDIFVMVASRPADLLDRYYRLTGHPVLLPKFAFYEGHLNAYNRDWWKESSDGKGILFEDGKRYIESQQDNGGVRESLNGENGNYLFSARAAIDRYAANDMPLGWILPNDGYGAGYGQTGTLDSNILNLKSFGDYARSRGVEIGLWTQSDLHPKDGVEALLQRDIVKEVRDAGVRVLKTDVAWVGWGYSFGLNGIADVAGIMPYYGGDARPFIITLDGWAGTQRYAGVWSGDQTGGEWEYIRFHIPTYIGSGLSGQPNICSDMDGIFGGADAVVNVRDFQWKAFSVMQLNMDGWGSNEKYPHAMGEPYTSINRMYLKIKSELLPYAYTWAREAVCGKPLMRAMFLDYPNEYTYGSATGYQYMFGPDFLVAPVYRDSGADSLGNDVRGGIYLPEGEWIDYFTGDLYEGECILEDFSAPLWKLPVFVRRGAVVPLARPGNNPSMADLSLRIFECWPASGKNSAVLYDDDGSTTAYLSGEYVETAVDALLDGSRYELVVHPAEGSYEGFVREQSTEIRINMTERPSKIRIVAGDRKIKAMEADSLAEYCSEAAVGNAVYFYDCSPELNRYATPGSPFCEVSIVKNPVLYIRIPAMDITSCGISVVVDGCKYMPEDNSKVHSGELSAPETDAERCKAGPYSVRLAWNAVEGADYYEIETGGQLHTMIRGLSMDFDNLEPETEYGFRLRAVNLDGVSDWTEYSCITEDNPLEYAISGILGTCTAPSQEGFEVRRLFDFAESGDMWHTKYRADALPFDLVLDLRGVNNIAGFEYLPRPDGGNGTIIKGNVSYSIDGRNWMSAGTFDWAEDGQTKTFVFDGGPRARYIRLSVTESAGRYGSGREIYVFKVPGTGTVMPGDINNDGRVDGNDFTSYMNYTGLRTVDSDFDYVSSGDIDANGLIDAYDVSYVAVCLDGGVDTEYWNREYNRMAGDTLSGGIRMEADRRPLVKGDTLTISFYGDSLESVNALSLAVPYDPSVLEYAGVEAPGLPQMENMTRDRLHSDGSRAVYPTFVNLGSKPLVSGNGLLFRVKFVLSRAGAGVPSVKDAVIVSPALEYKYVNVKK